MAYSGPIGQHTVSERDEWPVGEGVLLAAS